MDPSTAGAVAKGGSEALSGILQRMHEEELARKAAMQNAMQSQKNDVGTYGKDQQNMLQQMLAGYSKALGV